MGEWRVAKIEESEGEEEGEEAIVVRNGRKGVKDPGAEVPPDRLI